MTDTWQVVLGGVGGQGLIFAGLLLGEAAVYDGKNASQTQSYGIETRGGFSKSELVISEGEIVYPGMTEPNLAIILAKLAFDRLAPALPEGCLVVYDSAIRPAGGCETAAGNRLDFRAFPLSAEAKSCGAPQATNIVAIGATAGLTGLISAGSIEKALREHFSGDDLENSLKAFRAGYALAQKGG
ncbi:MAG: 2-oxoacid:ferredoxin oxidoreductase subunit gamma [Firmicutes bacterium]|nr:2-oxoacid:ferredoxin oxidoreductase subunit gamma [Bacillota bacterium]